MDGYRLKNEGRVSPKEIRIPACVLLQLGVESEVAFLGFGRGLG